MKKYLREIEVSGLVLVIIGIVFSSKAKNMLTAGNIEESEKALKTAQILMWVGVGFAALGLIALVVTLATGSFSTNYYRYFR